MRALQKEKAIAGATPVFQGKIVKVAWRLRQDGYSPSTVRNYVVYLHTLVKSGANLFDPESVKSVITQREAWQNSSKLIAIAAYSFFASLNNILWKPPRYKHEQKLPFVPLETELDALISSSNRSMAALLQLLKETGVRIGEACRLQWTDLDTEHNIVTLNKPEKGGRPRQFQVTSRLIAMLNTLPKEDQRLFGHMNARLALVNLGRLRKRVAHRLQNPRILNITLHSFRHWYATMLYWRTNNILHVQEKLGHRRLETTTIYTHLVQFESDEYHSAAAENIEEARKLIEAGFEYVCDVDRAKLFRKRK